MPDTDPPPRRPCRVFHTRYGRMIETRASIRRRNLYRIALAEWLKRHPDAVEKHDDSQTKHL